MPEQPIIEHLGPCPCPDRCGDLIRVHGTDATHLGYALSMLRAVADGDERFADTIKAALDPAELLRGCLEFARSIAFSMGTSDCNIPGVPHSVQQGFAADCAAVAAYLSGMADTIRIGISSANSEVVGQVAQVFDDLAAHVYSEQLDYITVHATSVTAAAGACKVLSDACARRYGMDFDEQADRFRGTLAAGA